MASPWAAGHQAIELDVYSVDAPGTSITFLATLTHAFGKQFQVVLDGTGTGQFSINRHDEQATAANLTPGNLVKVRLPYVNATDQEVFAFFLEHGDFTLATSNEEGGEDITFGGRGILAYLDRAVMWSHSYITRTDVPDDISDTGSIIGKDPYDLLWRLYDAGTGTKPGQILGRLIAEARAYARPQHPTPLLTIDWDYSNDSTAAAWDASDATQEFAVEIGSSLLDAVQGLLDLRLLAIRMDPAFNLEAYNRGNYGQSFALYDFGADAIRFVKGVNIADEIARQNSDPIIGTHGLVVGEKNAYGTAVISDAASRVTREVGQTTYGQLPSTLDALAAADLDQRLIRSETVPLKIASGDDYSVGLYFPDPLHRNPGRYWVGDWIQLHTGTGEQDFDHESFQIASITVAGKDTDDGEDPTDLDVTLEVGASAMQHDTIHQATTMMAPGAEGIWLGSGTSGYITLGAVAKGDTYVVWADNPPTVSGTTDYTLTVARSGTYQLLFTAAASSVTVTQESCTYTGVLMHKVPAGASGFLIT